MHKKGRRGSKSQTLLQWLQKYHHSYYNTPQLSNDFDSDGTLHVRMDVGYDCLSSFMCYIHESELFLMNQNLCLQVPYNETLFVGNESNGVPQLCMEGSTGIKKNVLWIYPLGLVFKNHRIGWRVGGKKLPNFTYVTQPSKIPRSIFICPSKLILVILTKQLILELY